MGGFDDRRPEQVDPRFDQSTGRQASDNLRQEAFGQPMERGGERNSVRNPNFDNPVDHLDRAVQIARSGNFRGAEREYFSAIRAADGIDQREVQRERQAVRERLQAEQDPREKRRLAEWDNTLNDMQRAPGFTRANLGLVYMRMGYQAEGMRLITEAAQLDPQMRTDPNFIRRLRALDQRGGMRDPRAEQFPQQGDTRQPGDPRQPGDTRQQVGQEPGAGVGPQDYDPHAAHRGRTRTGGGDAPATPAPEKVDVPSGTSRPDAQNFDNPYDHIFKANEEFQKNGKMSDAVKAEYLAAIKAADAIDRPYLKEQQKALEAALEKVFPKEKQDQVSQLEKEKKDILDKLPKESQEKIAELGKKLAEAKDEKEAEALRKQMRDLAPEAAKKQDAIDALMKDVQPIAEQLTQIELLLGSSTKARYAYAEALRLSGDNAGAKDMLGQIAKMDVEAAKDPAFIESAKAVGLDLTQKPAETTDATKPTDAAKPTAGGAEDPDAFDLLEQAHKVEKEKGFEAAKPLYDQAIAAADKIDQKSIADKLKEIETALKEPGVTDEKKATLIQLGQAFVQYQHAPFAARFQKAVAMNNSGDFDGAKALMAEAAKLDPEAGKEPLFLKAQEMVAKKEKITDEALKAAIASTPAGDGKPIEDPYGLLKQAGDSEKKENLKTAEEQMKKAIEAADKLPVDKYKQAIAGAEEELKKAQAAQDVSKPETMLAVKKAQEQVDGLKELSNLPALIRIQGAQFYMRHGKPDEAKAMLQQALEKDPTFKDDVGFQKMVKAVEANDVSTMQKALNFLKTGGKEILSDTGAGTVGLIAFNLTPGGKLLKLGSAVAFGGVTKAGLNEALGVEGTSFGSNMVWGGVDALAFVSGAGVSNKLMGRYEASIASKGSIALIARDAELLGMKNLVAKEEALIGNKVFLERALSAEGLAAAEHQAARQALSGTLTSTERKAFANLLAGTASEVEKTALAERLGKFGVQHEALLSEKQLFSEQVAKLTGANAPKGVDGLKQATDLLTRGVASQKELAKQELKTAIAEAPAWKKPLLWAQGHTPVAWRLPNASLEGYKAAEREALAAQGSRFAYLVPKGSSLRAVEARQWWRRAGIDAAAMGTGSLVYRGAHNASTEYGKIGKQDEQGNTYTAWNAAMGWTKDTAVGATTDAVGGALLMGTFIRPMGGIFTKHSGISAETNPLKAPVLPDNAGVMGKALYGAKMAKFGVADYLPKRLGDFGTSAGSWLTKEGTMRATGFSQIPIGLTIFAPKLAEGWGSYKKAGEIEKMLEEIQKPLTDANPTGSTEAPKPAADLPAEKPEPAKPSGSEAAPTPKPKADGGDGLPE